ncbi:accessory factor UbiK family protein [Franzmannia qiaohouensis]|uniref:Ubiquinone biosynthesis accessory factor UbiK n=1 Tax=Franzmannia qiaohouensis TaxID=1329370 RepID=A0ABU1H8I6_9GAMM|nr:accessory factor UbiK family protein [Halomonas qiaohouensis]MDR5903755.1 accessory factor UbiK family protein [Halomonas qiaohouensis]
MTHQDRFGRLARELGERLQGASQAPEEIHKGVQQVVRGACERLELVSREDFDILMDVLQRTRSRVETLEARVATLEAALDEGAAPSEESHREASGDTPPAEDAGGGEPSR